MGGFLAMPGLPCRCRCGSIETRRGSLVHSPCPERPARCAQTIGRACTRNRRLPDPPRARRKTAQPEPVSNFFLGAEEYSCNRPGAPPHPEAAPQAGDVRHAATSRSAPPASTARAGRDAGAAGGGMIWNEKASGSTRGRPLPAAAPAADGRIPCGGAATRRPHQKNSSRPRPNRLRLRPSCMKARGVPLVHGVTDAHRR